MACLRYCNCGVNQTPEFREAIKRVEKRQRDLNDILKAENDSEDSSSANGKASNNGLLKAKKARRGEEDGFESKGRSIVQNVTRLKEFLAENRDAYCDVMNNECLPDPITDLERDSIDAGANDFVRTANKLISGFKADLKAQLKRLSGQRIQHLEAVTDILDEYLRAVCAIHSKQKAVRIEKELEIQRLSRLEVEARRRRQQQHGGGVSSNGAASDLDMDNLRAQTLVEDSEEEFADLDANQGSTEDGEEGITEGAAALLRRRRLKKTSSSAAATAARPASAGNDVITAGTGGGYLYSSDDDNEQHHKSEFSPEEVQAFEQENQEMYEDLVKLKDNVQQIQTKVVKIAELQEIFTEKVLQQKDDIDVIAAAAVASTENVRDGNEELRKAIQRNASIRVYVLFFLIVMSFSLLFLDWYND